MLKILFFLVLAALGLVLLGYSILAFLAWIWGLIFGKVPIPPPPQPPRPEGPQKNTFWDR